MAPPRRPMARVPSELPRTPHGVGTDLSQNQLLSPSIPLCSQLVPRLSHPLSTERLSTIFSIKSDDILFPGDIVGEGVPLLAEPLRLILNQSIDKAPVSTDYQECAREFEVVRKLGTGNSTVVYLVREILFHFLRSEDRDDHMYQAGHHPSRGYGREYAIKLLFKANLDEEGLIARLVEATIHQAIPVHPNIVTLHRTMETSAFLFLLLEYTPGQELLYFLEQARHHYKDDPDTAADPALTPTSPTPALLSSIRPSQLLSHARLQLIASMFAQMCEAVATCHDASVFHRDIRPENFIVTDGWAFNQDNIRDRKVIVKLSDFGLSARDAVSSEMDCGSAPYMSYECRNNLGPTYKPRGADVWSLGIVLINMLYHCNPWVDTVKGGFSAFDECLSNPASFFMRRFTGMTLPVATFLVENVFCILDDPIDDSRRIGAREFGIWVRDLPALMAASETYTHTHVPSTVLVSIGHPLASAPPSHHPSVRPSLTRNTFRGVPDYDGHGGLVLPVLGLVSEEGKNGEWRQRPRPQVGHQELDVARSSPPSEWSTSNWRKYTVNGKGTTSSADPTEPSELLASASKRLAREVSRQACPARAPIQTPGSPVPRSLAVDIGPIFQAPYDPVFVERSESLASTSQALAFEVSSLTRSTVTKRTSRSKAAFGRGSNVATRITRSDRSNSNLHSSSACPTSVPKMIVESGPPPPPPKQRRKLSNYVRTHKGKFSVPRPVRDTSPDDDAEVRNESEADNCEDEFFDVDGGSYNGPRSTKTISKRSFSTGSFATRGSVDSGNIAWVYK